MQFCRYHSLGGHVDEYIGKLINTFINLGGIYFKCKHNQLWPQLGYQIKEMGGGGAVVFLNLDIINTISSEKQ